MPASPDPLNYFVGKGILKWKPKLPNLTTTVNIATGSSAATLASFAGLVSGQIYSIVATGIPVGAVFTHDGDATITLSANATATSAAAAATITPIFRDLGNVPEFEVSPKFERLDHFSSRKGIRFKDASPLRQKMMDCRWIMEEWTPENLALFLMGVVTPPAGPPTYSTITMLELDDMLGSLRLIGTNEIGVPCQVNIPIVNVTPGGKLGWITDEWGSMEINGEVLGDPSTGIFGSVYHGITGEVTT